jgi:hypothetical protein
MAVRDLLRQESFAVKGELPWNSSSPDLMNHGFILRLFHCLNDWSTVGTHKVKRDGIRLPMSQEDTQHKPDCNPVNEDAASMSLTVFERITVR